MLAEFKHSEHGSQQAIHSLLLLHSEFKHSEHGSRQAIHSLLLLQLRLFDIFSLKKKHYFFKIIFRYVSMSGYMHM